jgi:hypothetical protein
MPEQPTVTEADREFIQRFMDRLRQEVDATTPSPNLREVWTVQLAAHVAKAVAAEREKAGRVWLSLQHALNALTDIRRRGDYDVAELDIICAEGEAALGGTP